MSELIQRIITGIILAFAIAALLFFVPPVIFAIFILGIFAAILITEWPKLAASRPKLWLLTPIYPALPLLLIILMQLSGYKMLNFLIFSNAAVLDSASYFVGKALGKHKLMPSVSPKKTWEGFFGGVFSTLLLNILIFDYRNLMFTFKFTLPFTIAICFIALAGDLFESYLKRTAHLKDSANILPGHGGILDRIDSVLFIAPLVYLLRNYLLRLS